MPKTILLADDSPTIRKVVELTFGDTGIRVETAATGQEALERFERVRPDLVLADVVMPEPAGYELCRRVKESDHPVPVLLLAGTFDPYDIQRARACGADGRVVKPFETRALVERVESWLAGRTETAGSEAAEPAPPPPVPEPAPDPPLPAGLSAAEMDALVQAVLARLSDRVLREAAREILPPIAEQVVRERIRELEGEDLP